MTWRSRFGALGIGTRLTLGFGALAGIASLVVLLTWVAGQRVTADIELAELVRRPASLASTQAQANLLRMQLHVRGYLVLSDPKDIEKYEAARRLFESNLAALQSMSNHWPEARDVRAVQDLTNRYQEWSQLPERLFDLHDSPLKNRPALRLARIEVQSRLVQVLDAVDRIATLQRSRGTGEPDGELSADLLKFQTSFDAMATNLMAYGASGELNFKLNYGPQLATNAAAWRALSARRAQLTSEQRDLLAVIARKRAETTELALQIVATLNGEHAYEDLYLYRTEVAPQADDLLQRLADLTSLQQAQLDNSLERARLSLASVRLAAGIAGVLAVTLAVVLAYAVRRSVVVPLHRLTDVAERVAAGDLSARAEVASRDEIGVLAGSVNTMTHRLSETIRHLQSTFAEAQRAKASAEVASRAKSSFLANMSHELRTPLNAVLGYAQILQDEPGLSEFQLNGLDKIRRGGEHLLALINDVLDLARIEAGKVELTLQVSNLPSLLRLVESFIRVEAQRKGIEFECELAPDLPVMVRVDGKRLEQVLLNLLGNAVKFTHHGHVALRVRQLATTEPMRARLQFEVADSGIGIGEAEMQVLFRPFEQASDVQRQFGGTGLGLAISQQIITLMGGCIRVESELGRGSVFRFELEVELAQADAATAPQLPSREGEARGTDAARELPISQSVPSAEELALLHELARIGNMRSIVERADHLARLDPAHQAFAQRLRELAQGFQSRVILDWISELRHGHGKDAATPVRSSTAGL